MGKSTIKTHTMKNAQLMTLSIHEIQLDKENPRIKQYLEFYTQITSEMLALALSDSSNGDASTTYRSLKESIKVSGGIIHPIVVNQNEDGSYTVIEGTLVCRYIKSFMKMTQRVVGRLFLALCTNDFQVKRSMK